MIRVLSRGAAVAVVAASLSALFAGPRGSSWKASKIVLITIDTLRADRLGCYGYRRNPTSPNLDAWAKRAVLFERETSQAPWTVPSLGSLFTGRYPSEVGVYTNRGGISPDFVTLAEVFRRNGFTTATFNTHRLLVGKAAGFRRGFDYVYPERINTPSNLHKIPFGRVEPALMRWLEAHARDTFFLWIHDMDPHHPPTADNAYLKNPRWRGYDGEVRWVDEAFGRIRAKLKRLGIWDEAVVVFTADHGEAFGEHGIPGHQNVMYDEVLHIPLIISYPTMPRTGRIAAPVELLDVFPTLCELAGIAAPPGTRGQSLIPLIEGRPGRNGHRYLFHARYHFEDHHHELAVRDSRWKLLVKTPDRNRFPPSRMGARERTKPVWSLRSANTHYELYDLRSDPREKSNVAEQYPAVVNRLRAALAAWHESLSQRPSRAAPKLEPATLEALRALGYGPQNAGGTRRGRAAR